MSSLQKAQYISAPTTTYSLRPRAYSLKFKALYNQTQKSCKKLAGLYKTVVSLPSQSDRRGDAGRDFKQITLAMRTKEKSLNFF